MFNIVVVVLPCWFVTLAKIQGTLGVFLELILAEGSCPYLYYELCVVVVVVVVVVVWGGGVAIHKIISLSCSISLWLIFTHLFLKEYDIFL